VVLIPAGLEPENDYADDGQKQLCERQTQPLVREDLTNYDHKCSVEKELLIVGLKGLVAKTN
jgi:hypothetical protein